MFLQDIIQTLRESGVFATVIASAQANSSNRNNDSSDNVGARKLFSEKLRLEFPESTRRVLDDIGGGHDHLQAVPPLSPPGLHDVTDKS